VSETGTWEPTRPSSQPEVPVALIVLTALVAVLAFLLALEHVHATRAAVEHLPQPQRAASLKRAVEELRTVCIHPVAGLEGHCREQAEFALGFRECDASCRDLARRQLAVLPRPR
jgi:hypothetical protein